MAHHYDTTAVAQNFLQRRKSTTDTGIVSYISIFIQWNIKVYTHNCLLAGKVKLVDFHFSFYFKSVNTSVKTKQSYDFLQTKALCSTIILLFLTCKHSKCNIGVTNPYKDNTAIKDLLTQKKRIIVQHKNRRLCQSSGTTSRCIYNLLLPYIGFFQAITFFLVYHLQHKTEHKGSYTKTCKHYKRRGIIV